jgi:hypothetical protein
MGLDHSL